MAQRQYKIDLQDTIFPMLSEQQTRTIIGNTAGEAPGAGERPGIAYCHNVMPTKYGVESVGFLPVIPGITSPPAYIQDVRTIYGSAKTALYLAWDSLGNVYALRKGTTAWLTLPATSPATGGANFSSESVTVGTVNGVSYIYYSKIGAFIYNEATNSLDSVTLTGLTISSVLGVVATSGYLIAYTDQAIAWSSTIDPTDFVPSEVTGAGGGNVADLAGAILFATTNSLGLLIYSAGNVVAGTYTGNARFPFKFRELKDSKGGVSLDLVAYEANSDNQFVFSKAGLQSITSQRAEIVLPEVTDFLAGKRFEDFDESTLTFVRTDLTSTMRKKLKYVASRYLVISYGISSFTHALIYDLGLKKLGKIKLAHTDVFEYIDSQNEVSKESIALVTADGAVSVVDFSTSAAYSGVLVLGKLQATRNRLLTLLELELENIREEATLAVYSRASYTGKAADLTTAGTLLQSAENFRKYAFRTTAVNHSLLFIGQFNLVTPQITYLVAGRR